jgi:membrane protein required for beta-lactamase induction
MALICIVIALVLERAADTLGDLRNFQWFERYSQWMINHLPGLTNQGASLIVILLLPVIIVVAILQNSLDDAFFDLFSLLFALAVFIYSLGPGDLNRQVDNYLGARETGNDDDARQYATDIIGQPAPESPDQQTAEVMHAILYQANDRLFCVIFWFLLLGPLGAIVYRLTAHTMHTAYNNPLGDAAKKLQAIMAWAPVHLVAMGYALTGNYEGASRGFRDKLKMEDLSECNYNTLVTSGLGALKDCEPGEETACIRATRALVLRTLVVWVAVIALLTLIGWMS